MGTEQARQREQGTLCDETENKATAHPPAPQGVALCSFLTHNMPESPTKVNKTTTILSSAANKQLSSPTPEVKAPAKTGNGAATEAMILATPPPMRFPVPMQMPPIQGETDENDAEFALTPHRHPSPMQVNTPAAAGRLKRDNSDDGVTNDEVQLESSSVREGGPEADDDL
ncbi:hypothetical protein THAOC_30940, partial [Thalassiosira oceanica]